MSKLINELRGYQVFPRALVFDRSLSDRARFVYIYMASKPMDWEFYLRPMAVEIGYSVETLRKYIGELIDRGWLVRVGQSKGGDGRYGAVDYLLKAERDASGCTKKPCTENSDTVKNRHGKNPSQHNIDLLQVIDELQEQSKDTLLDKTIERKDIDKSISQKKEKIAMEFDSWWMMYDKKIGRSKCFARWCRLSSADRRKAIAHTPQYVAATPDKQYRKHPLTYLNGECWNDEILSSAKNDKESYVDEKTGLPIGMILHGDRSDLIRQSQQDLWQ